MLFYQTKRQANGTPININVASFMRIIKISRLLFLLLLFPTLLSGQQKEKPSAILEKGFLSPPESAKVWTWWHWMNGNVSKEGITADLEAMKRVGIGGLYNFHVGHQLPINGSVGFLSPQWWALSKFAAQEADRLNLKFGFNNCPGWSASGGPDVKVCLLYTSPSPRDRQKSRMPSSA